MDGDDVHRFMEACAEAYHGWCPIYVEEPSTKRQRLLDNHKQWRRKNPDRIRNNNAKWRKTDAGRASHRAKAKRRRARNPEASRDRYRREYERGAVQKSISALMRARLLGGKEGGRLVDLVGYSVAELRAHLEAQFLPGMMWGNFGAWEIDHRVPLSWFGPMSAGSPALREAWGLANLRPLWKLANRTKHATFAEMADGRRLTRSEWESGRVATPKSAI